MAPPSFDSVEIIFYLLLPPSIRLSSAFYCSDSKSCDEVLLHEGIQQDDGAGGDDGGGHLQGLSGEIGNDHVGTGDGVSEKRFFEIENEHPTYFLCDESGNVFKAGNIYR